MEGVKAPSFKEGELRDEYRAIVLFEVPVQQDITRTYWRPWELCGTVSHRSIERDGKA